MAEDLLHITQILLRKVPGGLAMSVTVMGTIWLQYWNHRGIGDHDDALTATMLNQSTTLPLLQGSYVHQVHWEFLFLPALC